MRINPDASTREGALRHAQMITAYWTKRGFNVIAEAIDTGAKAEHGTSSATVWGVRTDMVNGMPQKAKR